MDKKLVIIRRKHISDHGSDREFTEDVLEWTKEGTPFLVLPDDVEVIENRQRLGIMQFGCFEMKVIRKCLRGAGMVDSMTREELEAAIVLIPRFSKKIAELDC